jgi:hypothetical protein
MNTLRHAFLTAGAEAPNFFLIGGPKCATTSMAAALRHHPDVFMSERKEPHFFGSDLEDIRVKNRISPETYVALFKGADGQRRVGEASVWYLRSATAAAEIHSFDRDARILVMLRNPFDVRARRICATCVRRWRQKVIDVVAGDCRVARSTRADCCTRTRFGSRHNSLVTSRSLGAITYMSPCSTTSSGTRKES